METFTKAQFWAELEVLGEDVVRERVIAKVYGSGNRKLELAQEWLRVQEEKRTDARTTSAHELNVEALKTAKSAKNAAWVAAASALIAAIAAVVAIFLSGAKGG